MSGQCVSSVVLSQRTEKIICLIPADFENRDHVVKMLQDRENSIRFTAPTAMTARWQEVAEILTAYLPDPKEELWAGEILKIFSEDFEG